jgi:hypothetical protein
MKNIKIIARFTATALAALTFSTAVATTASAAPLGKCNVKTKGRTVGNQVCAVKNGKYSWVKVVPVADAPAPAKAPASTAPSATVPDGYTLWTAKDASWSVTVPDTWNTEALGGSNSAYATLPSNSSFTFNIWRGLTFPTDPKGSLAQQVSDARTSPVPTTVASTSNKVIGGHSVTRITTFQNEYPTSLRTEIIIFGLDQTPFDSDIRIDLTYKTDDPDFEKYKGDLDAMLSSVVVRI